MKKYLFYVLLLITFGIIESQEGVIDLKNSDSNKNNSINKPLDLDKDIIRDSLLIPNSIYIGELSDFKSVNINKNSINEIVNGFLTDIKNGKDSNYISEDYKFIFKTVYKDLLLSKSYELIRWNIGYFFYTDNNISIPIELYFRDNIYIGTIYLEKNKNWYISDLQISEQEKRVFDPSSLSF